MLWNPLANASAFAEVRAIDAEGMQLLPFRERSATERLVAVLRHSLRLSISLHRAGTIAVQSLVPLPRIR